ncbi:MAG: WecB/TagA/CpsF family glycosyltransferase [bacterium]|nr:MAG: WecB/TagA/CpsF family glycosyltransferase [bacterium]
MIKTRTKTGPKHGHLLGIKVSSTSRPKVLKFVRERLKTKEKFYIVTPNPEIVLMAMKDWLLKKAIFRSDLSVPDGIGLAQARKYLSLPDPQGLSRLFELLYQGYQVAIATFNNREWLTKDFEVIKGRELFFDIVKIADENKLNVYLFGGENGEQEIAMELLKKRFPNITFKTHYKFPNYTLKGQPATVEDRRLHKKILGSIKLFEPDLVFVAMTPPKQEKWIFRNFFRLRATGAMAVGGTFNFVSGNSKLPPVWMAKSGLEWVWRLINEPYRYKRVFNAFPKFPWTVFVAKLKRRKFEATYSVVEK